MTPAQNKPRRGCLFWGGIIAAILLLLALFAAYTAYSYAKHLVADYTDTKPIAMPALHLSGDEVTNLQQRVKKFEGAIEDNKPEEPLILTADEVNALIANENKTNPSPVRLYFSFNDNRVQAQLSLPTDGFGLKMFKGRYFNGSADFALSLHDGRLMLRVKSLTVKGRPLPERLTDSIRAKNFAEGWTNDPESAQDLAKLQEIRIEDGKLIVVPKSQAPQPALKLEKPNSGK